MPTLQEQNLTKMVNLAMKDSDPAYWASLVKAGTLQMAIKERVKLALEIQDQILSEATTRVLTDAKMTHLERVQALTAAQRLATEQALAVALETTEQDSTTSPLTEA